MKNKNQVVDKSQKIHRKKYNKIANNKKKRLLWNNKYKK